MLTLNLYLVTIKSVIDLVMMDQAMNYFKFS